MANFNKECDMTRRYFRFRDDLPVLLSLAIAVAILVATVSGIWVWSIVLENASMMTLERKLDLP